jgi:hypothetical protein
VWPLVKAPEVEKIVRHAQVVDTLLREATEWKAPTSLLIAPVGWHRTHCAPAKAAAVA